MHEAQFYIKEGSSTLKCILCPHKCEIKDGGHGKCNSKINKAGKLYSNNYGRVTGLSFDPVEKKPLYHFYPGRLIQSVGTYGCNFKCLFCQNYHISQSVFDLTDHRITTPEEIIKITLNNKDCCGISYTYNEPVVWYEYMMDIAVKSKEEGLANAVVSNGFINPEPLDRMIDVIDAFNIDLKAFNDDFYIKYTGGKLEPVKKTLKTIAGKNVHLEVTNLIIPGLNDDVKTFKKMIRWIADELGPDTPLHISRYFPAYKMNLGPTPISTITELRELAKSELNFVYCGNVSYVYDGSDSICPGCNKTVIKREGYTVFTGNIDQKGHCTNCNYKLVVC